MAISISETALRAVAEGVSVRRRATACGTLESKLGVHLIAEAADFFPCFLLRRRSERPQRDKPFRSLGLFEDLLAIQLGHARVFRRLLQLLIPAADLFLAGVLGDALLV